MDDLTAEKDEKKTEPLKAPEPQKEAGETAPAKKKSHWWGTMTHIVAYPVALVAGYFPFLVTARAGIYKNYAKDGYFDDIQADFKKRYGAIKNEALKDLDNAFKFNIDGRKNAINAEYREAIRGRFNKLGVKTVGQYWQGLNPNQKYEAIFMGAAATGIALTTLLAITNNEWLLSRLNEKEREATTDDKTQTR